MTEFFGYYPTKMGDLVPLREAKGNLYTHLFRAVYATIATHWFCPPTVSELEFRAYIQGHFKILHQTNSEKRTSMAAQRRSQLSRQKVNRYIDAIMAYNDVLDRPHSDKWLVSIGFASARSAIAALKRLTSCGQSVIDDVLNSRQDEVQFHHAQHQLGQYHNQKGSKVPKIESVISLD